MNAALKLYEAWHRCKNKPLLKGEDEDEEDTISVLAPTPGEALRLAEADLGPGHEVIGVQLRADRVVMAGA